MSYLIEKIEQDDLAAFLLNPYSKSAYFRDHLLQKYPKDHLTDDVYMIKEEKSSIKFYGRVYYWRREIIEALPFNLVQTPPFVAVRTLRSDLKGKITADLERMVVSRAAEAKSSVRYAHLVKTCRSKFIEYAIFEILGAAEAIPYIIDRTAIAISKLICEFNLDELCDIRHGNLELVNKGMDDIFMSENFLTYHILLKEIKEEAEKIVAAGKLTQRQRNFKNIIDKTKNCNYPNFKVETTMGTTVSCRNIINVTGSVFVNEHIGMETFDFEQINKIIAKGKVIYEKGVF